MLDKALLSCGLPELAGLHIQARTVLNPAPAGKAGSVLCWAVKVVAVRLFTGHSMCMILCRQMREITMMPKGNMGRQHMHALRILHIATTIAGGCLTQSTYGLTLDATPDLSLWQAVVAIGAEWADLPLGGSPVVPQPPEASLADLNQRRTSSKRWSQVPALYLRS